MNGSGMRILNGVPDQDGFAAWTAITTWHGSAATSWIIIGHYCNTLESLKLDGSSEASQYVNYYLICLQNFRREEEQRLYYGYQASLNFTQSYHSCSTSRDMSGVLPLISVSGAMPPSAYKSSAVDDQMLHCSSAQQSHNSIGVDFFTVLHFTALFSSRFIPALARFWKELYGSHSV